jgi:hypothetical protein
MQHGQSFVYGFSHGDPSTGFLCVRSIEVAMPPIFSGSTGLHVVLVEDQVLEVAGDVEADFKGIGVGAPGGVFAVDGFDDDASHRLKSSCEQVVEQSQAGLQVRDVFGHMEDKGLCAAP